MKQGVVHWQVQSLHRQSICQKIMALKDWLIQKKISEKKREKLFAEIKEVGDVGIGIVSHRTIDKINILQATFKAMRQAITKLERPPDKSLIDGFGFPDQNIKK